MSEIEQGRTLKISIVRFDPQIKNDTPRVETYNVTEAPGMTLFIALMTYVKSMTTLCSMTLYVALESVVVVE